LPVGNVDLSEELFKAAINVAARLISGETAPEQTVDAKSVLDR
jgi:hypothetical protein